MPEYTVAEITPESAPLVPPLIYRGFGYTYTDEAMYRPERILAAMEGGKNHFFAVLDGARQARAFLALRLRYPAPHLAELGALLVDPAIPGPLAGNFLRMLTDAVVEKARWLARERGLRALVSQEVTVHKLTQRLVEQLGFVSTGILLGWTPAWAERPRMLPEDRLSSAAGNAARSSFRLGHRRTEIVSVRPFLKYCPQYTAALPHRFERALRMVYEKLKLPVSFAPPSAPEGASALACEVDLRRSLAVIELVRVGADAPAAVLERLNHYRDGRVDLIHVALPLSGPGVDDVIEALGQSVRYAALLPFYRGHDVLLLQCLNDVDIELEEGDLLSPVAKALFKDEICPLPPGGGRP